MNHYLHKHWTTLGVLILFCAGLFLAQRSYADPGTYALVKSVVGAGGGATANGGYALVSTLGQPVAGRTTGGTYTLNTGFLVANDTITPVVSPGNVVDTNWRNTPRSQTFTASDGDSGLFTGADASFTLTAAAESASVNAPTIVSRAVSDRAGNVTVRSVSALIDTTSPIITATVPLANAANWYKSAVAVGFACSDGRGSGVAVQQCAGGTTLATEGRNQSVTGTATDRAGNVKTTSASGINIDLMPPVVASAILDSNNMPLAANSDGWYNRAVVVRFTASDPQLADSTPGSGVVSQPTDRYLASDGANQTATASAAMDEAGNSKIGTRTGINIDATAPTTTAKLVCTSANGWCRSDRVTVTLSATDQPGLSGVKETRYAVNNGTEQVLLASGSFDVPLSGVGIATVKAFAIDRAGNRGATNTYTIKYDTIAPSLQASVNPAPNAEGWNRTPLTVHFDAVDQSEGAGTDVASVTPDVQVATETAGQKVVGRASDRAGNIGSTSTMVKLDMTKPFSPQFTVSPAPNAAGWNNDAVTVSFSKVSDAGTVRSLIATCTEQQGVLQQTAGTVVSGTCTDKADNVSDPTRVTVRIDTRPPSVTVGGVTTAATYKRNALPTATCPTTDALSGVAQMATATITGGNAEGVGRFTVTCAGARDTAGNVAEPVSTHYYVAYPFGGFARVAQRPTINRMQAGKTVEIAFTLGGNYGTDVLATAPTFGVMQRDPNAVVQDVATTNASVSSLRYDQARSEYVYTWKTSETFAGQRRTFLLTFNDGYRYAVDFEFTP